MKSYITCELRRLLLLVVLVSGCTDYDSATAPEATASPSLLSARDVPVDTSRFTSRFRKAGQGGVFITLTGQPTNAAVSQLRTLGLRGPSGAGEPRTFENLQLNAVAGYLSATDVVRVAALPFVLQIESSEDEDSIFGSASSRPINGTAAEIRWNLHRVRAPDIWRDFGAAGERQNGLGWEVAEVMVLDDGLDYRLAEGITNPWDWYRVVNDGNFTGDPTPVYFGSHGTAVGSFVTAEPNGVWGVGVAPRARIRVAKVLPTGTDWIPIVSALDHAYRVGSTVVNMSFGNCGALPPSTVHNAIKQLANRVPSDAGSPGAGVSLVAGGGNGYYNCTNQLVPYPAAYDEVIAVAAIGEDDRVDPDFSFGAQIELSAPGLCVDGLSVGGGVDHCISGTSFAAPHVSGLIAAIRARNNTWSAAYVRQQLRETAIKLHGQTTPRDSRYGYGLVNAYDVLAGILPPSVTISGPPYISQSGSYRWTAQPLGGDGSYTYQWYRRTYHHTTTCSYETAWVPVGTGSTLTQQLGRMGYNFLLRVDVQSAGQSSSATTTVRFVEGLICPQSAERTVGTDVR